MLAGRCGEDTIPGAIGQVPRGLHAEGQEQAGEIVEWGAYQGKGKHEGQRQRRLRGEVAVQVPPSRARGRSVANSTT